MSFRLGASSVFGLCDMTFPKYAHTVLFKEYSMQLIFLSGPLQIFNHRVLSNDINFIILNVSLTEGIVRVKSRMESHKGG